VIQLQAHALLAADERRSDRLEALQVVQRQVKRMNRMIEDLLDVTRIEAGTLTIERSPLAPQALIDEVLQAHLPDAAAGALQLSGEVRPGTPEVDADRGRIIQVLDNLIGNAIKFTRSGGRITVVVSPGPDEAVFSVSDTGAGMDAETLKHVFERLWQAGADRRGVGLGLAIVKAIVDAHGGRVWVESAPGRGSRFHFSLPAASRA
jgi:signal transduction histidine kinase